MLITIDGIDGAGKSTQCAILEEKLKFMGLPVLRLIEPGGTFYGDKIRELLLTPSPQKMDNRTEVLLFMASRAQLYADRIMPALAKKKIVLTDRWAWSTFAYQTTTGLTFDQIEILTDFATSMVYPSLTIILDLDPEEGFKRKGRKGGQLDRIEQRNFDYHQKVANNYRRLAREFKLEILDGAQNVSDVADEIWLKVKTYIEAHK